MERMIPRASVMLEGFTVKELKVIMRAIREVEDHEPNKVVFIFIDDQTLNKEEAAAIIREIWPE